MDTATLPAQLWATEMFRGGSLHRFSIDEYEKLIETGFLVPEHRVELLDGLLIDKMSQGPPHAYTVDALNAYFLPREQNRWVTRIQSPVRLNGPWLPEPDVALLHPPRQQYRDRQPTAAEVFLLIEVAESSLPIDQEVKLRAYARSGIPEYWIVNLPEKIIEVYRQPDVAAERYDAVRQFQPNEQLAPEQFPDLVLSVNDILA